ncbi:MAG: bifunctional ADP-dependent NAD(P)H-hydrate dehydratase/NAD(P)H-hydrate epimerase [Desulfobulbaceae bacterium]|nr:MAG: bifunctional ADP-dependent NAD(P)H-hydrate dehydratase/NAD(P)H-hydrate epimerase [Desulfobulbaceae bacterium]
MKICSAAQSRFLDQTTIAGNHLSGLELMENAGRGTVALMLDYYGDCKERRVAVFAGPGNNGGDGFVVARHLHELGAEVSVFLLVNPDRVGGDAAQNLQRLPAEIVVRPLLDQEAVDSLSLQVDIIVDALLGTGLTREVTGLFARLIDRINRSGVPVVAVDIPSGLDADSGVLWGCCLKADLTATYGVAKTGLVQYPGADYVGRLEVVDIGIPAEVLERAAITSSYLTEEVATDLLPQRQNNAHKGSHGHILVLAGSRGKTGAAVLAAHGALRSGVGLVSLCVPEGLNTIFEGLCLEAMTIPLRGLAGHALTNSDFGEIVRAAVGKRCLVVGPGLGLAPGTVALVNQVVRELEQPLVLDADALNGLELAGLTGSGADRVRVLTPHPGEMARLTGLTTQEVQNRRLQVAGYFARQYGVVVVLKGAATVVAGPDGELAVNSTGNHGMGTGGMGDVLSGVIAGLLAQQVDPFQAACLAVYSHGRAGDLLMAQGSYGYLASELAAMLPRVWAELHSA